ncbi:hypothetical protein EVAR_55309_1 [Eumeta japonica]|uniref:Uncharacterized protein n=1 Tax=Eumeta variegata TaxID=151549 RepID=A0A4C1ZDC7_EUMVA|nr:hypothetical protein EVAR_55309_1 [Eumeta japonica]
MSRTAAALLASCRNLTGHTFDCSPDPTSVFNPSSVLRFGPGPACGSVPIRFYSCDVRNSLPHPAFNPDFATSHNSDLDEAGGKDYIKGYVYEIDKLRNYLADNYEYWYVYVSVERYGSRYIAAPPGGELRQWE